jgi:hypothetical protein
MFKSALRIEHNKVTVALLLILVGVCGRIIFISYANIETVLAIALLSGIILGGYYCILVPLGVMLISDWYIYSFTDHVSAFGIWAIIGLTFFTWSGYVMIGLLGRLIKPKVAYTVRGVAVIVGFGLIATLIYDAWTLSGYWLFLSDRTAGSFWGILGAQVPFTLYHLMSSLIFVPMFSSIFIHIHEHGFPFLSGILAPSEQREEGG